MLKLDYPVSCYRSDYPRRQTMENHLFNTKLGIETQKVTDLQCKSQIKKGNILAHFEIDLVFYVWSPWIHIALMFALCLFQLRDYNMHILKP